MKGICMAPDCGLDEHARGLCRSHYRHALTLVKSGHWTWYDLECRGKAKRPRSRVKLTNKWLTSEPEPEIKTLKSRLCALGQELILPALILCFVAVPVGVIALAHLVLGLPFK